MLIPAFWLAARFSKTLRGRLTWNSTKSSRIGTEARYVGLLVLLVFCAYAVIWAGYFFDTGARGTDREDTRSAYEHLPAATHIQSFLSQRERMQKGQHSYFRGSMRYTGLWDYYPTLFVVKHTLPFHALLLIGLLVIIRKRRYRDPKFQVMILVPLVIAVALVTLNRVQIGYRHALPLVPFWCLWIGLAVRDGLLPRAYTVPRLLVRLRRNNRHVKRIAPRLAVLVGLILLAAHASSSLRTHPYELSYFNEPAGGPDAGVRWALDSNSDWGQALPDLERYVRENKIDRIRFWYFGPWESVERGERRRAGHHRHQSNRPLEPLPAISSRRVKPFPKHRTGSGPRPRHQHLPAVGENDSHSPKVLGVDRLALQFQIVEELVLVRTQVPHHLKQYMPQNLFLWVPGRRHFLLGEIRLVTLGQHIHRQLFIGP